MITVGIDVAKDKHDCFIMNSEGEVLFNPFVIQNNREGFDSLYEKICSVADDFTKVKVGLEATGHYSYNILGYLLDKGLQTYVINPLHTNLYRKSLSLDVYEKTGGKKNYTQQIVIYYRFVGFIEIPKAAEDENYKTDTRTGVEVEYIPAKSA